MAKSRPFTFCYLKKCHSPQHYERSCNDSGFLSAALCTLGRPATLFCVTTI